MDEVSGQVVVGVVSGIITSVVIFIFIKAFESWVVPAVRQIVYKGIDVSGPWYWKNSYGNTAKMELRQYADRISGVYTYVDKSNIKIYNAVGRIQDRFVQLTMTSADPKRLGVLSFVFEVVGDGAELCGCSIFYATNCHYITSHNESFFRHLADAENSVDDSDDSESAKAID
ncbi:hypothetical protein [Pseudomonas sp. MGal98]|uniref:hypothetical protein n=1 Tax=Pseudomonas sp. MGal98 TaxID=3162460 RepID=UPI0032EB357F